MVEWSSGRVLVLSCSRARRALALVVLSCSRARSRVALVSCSSARARARASYVIGRFKTHKFNFSAFFLFLTRRVLQNSQLSTLRYSVCHTKVTLIDESAHAGVMGRTPFNRQVFTSRLSGAYISD